ncbi:MAG TPA: hypothetical protein VJS64_07475 [Pyrinomonadaceae bacterium]|nr:hypothetical protein [Pyrinomonadaceae bacterium]
MKTLRCICASLLLTTLLALPVAAGDQHAPGRNDPGDVHEPGKSAPGEIHDPGLKSRIEIEAFLLMLGFFG